MPNFLSPEKLARLAGFGDLTKQLTEALAERERWRHRCDDEYMRGVLAVLAMIKSYRGMDRRNKSLLVGRVLSFVDNRKLCDVARGDGMLDPAGLRQLDVLFNGDARDLHRKAGTVRDLRHGDQRGARLQAARRPSRPAKARVVRDAPRQPRRKRRR
jgi:hypothetical protein